MNYVNSLISSVTGTSVMLANTISSTPNGAGQRSIFQYYPLVAGGKHCTQNKLFPTIPDSILSCETTSLLKTTHEKKQYNIRHETQCHRISPSLAVIGCSRLQSLLLLTACFSPSKNYSINFL